MYEVEPDDIRTAGYGLTIPEGERVDEQIQHLIDKAETRLNALVPTLPDRVTGIAPGPTQKPAIDLETVQGVIEDMVLRVLRNPRALRSLGIDDFQSVIDTTVTSGLLYVSGDELALLSPRARRQVRSMRMHIPSWRLPGDGRR